MDTDGLAMLGPVVSAAADGVGVPLDRRAMRDARRRERHSRRLYAFAGLSVLAAFFAAAVAVVDVVR